MNIFKRYIQYIKRIKMLKRVGWGWDITTGIILVHPKLEIYLTKDIIKNLSDNAFDRLIRISSSSKPKHWNEVIV